MRLVAALAFTCQLSLGEEVVVEDAADGGSAADDDGASADAAAEGSGAGAAAPAAVDIPAQGEDINRTTFIQLTLSNLSLVNFYAPWCEPCKELEPQWEDAAARLAALDPPIPSGRVDAERVKDVASRFNITRYPGLMVFRGSTPYEVPTAEFSADGLVEHMLHQRKLSVASQPVSTVKEVERMSQSAWKWEGVTKVAIILGLFPAGADAPPAEQGIGAPRPRGAIELSMFGDLSYTLHTQRPGFAFAHSFSPAVHTAYGVGKLGPEWEGGDVSNGTLVVVLADQLRQEARGGSEFVLDATSSGVAELAASVLPRHPAASHARLDLSALLAEHASKISTQGRDQTEHHDGSPLSPSERSSRAAIYDAAMDRAGRRAVKQLVQWVTAACTAAPLVGELNTANTPFSPHPLYQLPLMILFYNQPATTKVWRDSLSAIAASEQPRNESEPVLQFALASSELFQASLPDLGLEESLSDAAVVIVGSDKRKYTIGSQGPDNGFVQAERRAGLQRSLTSRRVRSFVHSWYAGKLKPYLRSAPAPESQPPGTVQLVVGSTFSRMVLDDESAAEHVLIQLYSPHSDPCRRLVPHFEALAKRLAEHSDPVVRAVVVAAIDVDSNDTPAPYDNRGLPTVYLSSRGARGSPKQMEVAGSADEVVEFMARFVEEETAATAKSEL